MKKIIYFLIPATAMLLSASLRAQKTSIEAVKWHIAGHLPVDKAASHPGLAGAFAGVSGKWMYVGGGTNFPNGLPWDGGKKKYYDAVYFFQKSTTFSGMIKASPKKAILPLALAYGVSIQADNAVIWAGGENENGHSASVYRLGINPLDTSITFQPLPDLPVAVSNASGTYCDGKIFIAGGETDQGTSDDFFVLDLAKTGLAWKKIKHLPAPASHSVLITQSNGHRESIYLIGGRAKTASGISLLYDNVYEYDSKKDQWKTCAKLPYAISAHVSLAVNKHFILIAGGDTGETFSKVEKLIALINKETDPSIKAKLTQEKNQLQKNHPGFNKDVLLYNTVAGTWSRGNSLAFDAPVTTTALQWGNDIIIPLGEIKAGIRTTQILSGKIFYK